MSREYWGFRSISASWFLLSVAGVLAFVAQPGCHPDSGRRSGTGGAAGSAGSGKSGAPSAGMTSAGAAGEAGAPETLGGNGGAASGAGPGGGARPGGAGGLRGLAGAVPGTSLAGGGGETPAAAGAPIVHYTGGGPPATGGVAPTGGTGGTGGVPETGGLGGTGGGQSTGAAAGAAGDSSTGGVTNEGGSGGAQTCSEPCAPRDDCDETATCNSSTGECEYTLVADGFCEPLPAFIPSPIDRTVPANLREQTRFLYEGANPVQVGVTPAVIEEHRVAIINGKAILPSGEPLSRVRVSVKNHPEFGYTLSRYDGEYDIVVNGGGVVTVEYERPDYLPAQRQVHLPWRDYQRVEDVALVAIDDTPTLVDSTSPSITVHQTEVESDADGERRMTLLFAPGTTATLLLPDCTEQTLTNYSVQGVEYTVGPGGLSSMPAALPPTSAYTYAIELMVTEALEADATSVSFNQPVVGYVENFLGMPVGIDIPLGWYDRQKSQWIPSENGRVVRIAAISDGQAVLEVDDSGAPATAEQLAELGVTEGELTELAGLYEAGAELSRLTFEHFTPGDANPSARVFMSRAPYAPPPNDKQSDDSCEIRGSTIECQNQVLGESIPIAGTELTLEYRSSRVPGFHSQFGLHVTAAAESSAYQNRHAILTVAGRQLTQPLPSERLDRAEVLLPAWDGRDRYGRFVQGSVNLNFALSASSEAIYCLAPWFAQTPSECLSVPTRRMVRVTSPVGSTTASAWDARGFGIGGWVLSSHHVYDRFANTLLLGNGQRKSTSTVPRVLTVVAGTGTPGDYGDDGPATDAALNLSAALGDIAVASDGTVYFTDDCRVRSVDPNGLISTVAGTGSCSAGISGVPDPEPEGCGVAPSDPVATDVDLDPVGLGIGPDDGVYIASAPVIGGDYGLEVDVGFIFRFDPESGTLRRVAGSTTPTELGDGRNALDADLRPTDVAVGGDGAIYIADTGNNRIRRVGTDGRISTVAGGGGGCYCCASASAIETVLGSPTGIAVDSSGRVVFADVDCGHVLALTPDGRTEIVTGDDVSGIPTQVAIDSRDRMFVSTSDGLTSEAPKQVFLVDATGSVERVAGDGTDEVFSPRAPATSMLLSGPGNLAMDSSPDGSILLRDSGTHQILRVFPDSAGSSSGNVVVPDESGQRVFEFERSGRHVRTLDALTGEPLQEFQYDSEGRLVDIADADANTTTIERNANGAPTAIVSPDGLRTTFELDENGYLARVTSPASESTLLVHSPSGLLTQLTDPRGNTHSFAYDASGRLVSDADATSAEQTLEREEFDRGYRVTHTSPMERSTTYEVQRPEALEGGRSFTNTAPDGTVTSSVFGTDGVAETTMPDGTVRTTVASPDARFGMRAPVIRTQTVQTPGGRVSRVTTNRTTVFSEPNNSASALVSILDEVDVNGALSTTLYEASLRRYTRTSPEGRVTYETIDGAGRVVLRELPGLAPIAFAYDGRGRIVAISTGSGASARVTTFDYEPTTGWLSKVTDPMLRETQFTSHDPVGRVMTQLLPGAREVGFGYDENSNVMTVLPPEQPAHAFEYDSRDLMSVYEPPPPTPDDPGNWLTTYSYDPDRALTDVVRPDGLALAYAYDLAGRLHSLTYPDPDDTNVDEQMTLTYDGVSRPQTLTSGSGITLSYGYDGPLVLSETWSGAVAGSIARDYDDNFRLASETVGTTPAVSFSYDADGLLAQAGALTLVRDPDNGLLRGTVLGSIEESLGYNEFGELTSFDAVGSGGSTLLQVAYERDKLGRITTKTENVDGVIVVYGYQYDDAGRLVTVTRDGVDVAAYTYDANGNRLSKVVPSEATLSADYDDQDRLLSYGDSTYTYTANGELRTKTTPDGTTTYTFDALGNLRRVVLPDGTDIEYLVDGKNRRVGKRVDGVLVQGLLWGSQLGPVAELDGTGNIVSRFVYGTRVNVPEYVIRGSVTYRIITDHLGSPRLVVDAATGVVVQRMDYDEWGGVLRDTAPGLQPFGFAGGVYDRDTDLVRFGARELASREGRWLSKDALLFQGGDFSLFSYAWADPVNRNDTTGLRSAQEIADSAAADARSRFPGEWWNGRGDAYRHCVASCEVTREHGARTAEILGELNEWWGDLTHKQTDTERTMDEWNNAVGREFGKTGQGGGTCPVPRDCASMCAAALAAPGALIVHEPGPLPGRTYFHR